ncbi:MAG: hypothetical protein WAK82_09880 [Streptosporangiaceae bacterium]
MVAVRQLPSGARLLHIGPHKTGSSAIQGALHTARERLAAQGVIYPGRGRQTLWPILAVTGQPPLRGEPAPDSAWWDQLAQRIRTAGDQKVVLSSEFFSEADDATAARVVADLGPGVHVVVTLRPLNRIMPSQWQQYIQNGYRFGYTEWLEGILSDPPRTPTPGFWRRHRHDELVARWAQVAGVSNVTVIVLDETDRLMLLREFESMLGLPDGFLVPAPGAANRSLTEGEAELVLRLNEEFSRREWPDRSYARFMRYGVIEQMKTARRPAAGEPAIATPAWAEARAAEIGTEMAGNIKTLGVEIVGDIEALGAPPITRPVTPMAAGTDGPSGIALEAAVQAIVGACAAGGAGGLPTEDLVRGVAASSLTKVLINRGRQRLARALPRTR